MADLEDKLGKLKQPQDKAGLPAGSVDCRKAPSPTRGLAGAGQAAPPRRRRGSERIQACRVSAKLQAQINRLRRAIAIPGRRGYLYASRASRASGATGAGMDSSRK